MPLFLLETLDIDTKAAGIEEHGKLYLTVLSCDEAPYSEWAIVSASGGLTDGKEEREPDA